MVNRPDQDMQGVHSPERKLVLPAPPDAGLHRRHYSSPRPGQSINRSLSAAPHGLFTQLIQRVRTEPPFALLCAAIALVVVSSFVFVAYGLSAVNNSSNAPAWTSSMVEHPTPSTPQGTVDIQPKFPTPVSNKGSSSSSQPSGVPNPNYQPTPDNNGDQGSLTVTISNVPDVVNNDSTIQVNVQTSEPNVNIRLQVNYNAVPFYYVSGGNNTDDNGNGTLNWNVRVRGFGGNGVQAVVVVVATDNNGQQATSDPMTVEVTQ